MIILIISVSFSKVNHLQSWDLKINLRSVKQFARPGPLLSVAYVFYFIALFTSFIARIQPIKATESMFALIFSYISLREEERMTIRVFLAVSPMVAGVILAAL